MRRHGQQLGLAFRTHGGARPGAGRKRVAPRPGVPHRTRALHDPRHPVHMTLRAGTLPVSLRSPLAFHAVRGALARASRGPFRVIAFSVQADHLHLIVEADAASRLRSGLQGLAIRIAKAVNHALKRRGTVWTDRYHARALTTPRAVRHALVYVLQNFRKHCAGGRALDPCSSAAWFTGWKNQRLPSPPGSPVETARTWLAGWGWRRLGLIDVDEQPSARRMQARLPARPAT